MNRNGSYSTLSNRHTVEVHPQSSLFVGETEADDTERSDWQKRRNEAVVRPGIVVYSELVFTTKEYMRNVIEVRPEWLAEMAPHFYKAEDILSETKLGLKRKPK